MKPFYFEYKSDEYIVRKRPINIRVATFTNETDAAWFCDQRNELFKLQGNCVLIGYDMLPGEYVKMREEHATNCPAYNGAPVCRCRGERRLA